MPHRLPEVIGKDIQDFDIASADDCRRLVTEIRPDVVISAVAYTDVTVVKRTVINVLP